ncbi:O-antigen polysaccharide polymerase Wzy [Nocardioides dongxiaopingii]|uniref:O-antigen polysaccharide polymerase Wzy n=1 Tax=Nocardioides dongxiaopingii TaxID=2576036 RepID=UPI001484C95F|nr:O-antigen polysaccharide polymerase Wzy [Nocardioides dongxiaopingii]
MTVTALVVFVAILPDAGGFSLFVLAVGAVFVSGFCLLAVARNAERGVWSAQLISLLVLMIFHLGALPEFLYTDTAALAPVERFIHQPEAATAAWLAMTCALAFTFGCLVVGGRATARPPHHGDLPSASSFQRTVADVGSTLALASMAAWGLFALRAGLSFGSTYQDYLQARAQAPLQLIYYGLAVGVVFAALERKRLLPRLAMVAFTGFIVLAFPLGLRGEVLFPLAAMSIVLGAQRRMPRPRVLAIAVVALLVPIGIVSDTRQGTSLEPDQVVTAPTRALSEMGGSLAVVHATVTWHDTRGEPFYQGATYLAPINDAFERYALRQSPTPESQNLDHMSTQIEMRVGNVGGSVIGEAYNNFAVPGALVIMFAWGWGLARLNRLASRGGAWLILTATTTLVFQMLVRNSFASTPSVLLITALVLVPAWLLGHAGSVRARRSAGDLSA